MTDQPDVPTVPPPMDFGIRRDRTEEVAKAYHKKLCAQMDQFGVHAPLDCPHAWTEATISPNKAYCDNCRITMNRWDVLSQEHQDLMRMTVRLVLEANEETE